MKRIWPNRPYLEGNKMNFPLAVLVAFGSRVLLTVVALGFVLSIPLTFKLLFGSVILVAIFSVPPKSLKKRLHNEVW